MSTTTKIPATVRELAELADASGLPLSEYMATLPSGWQQMVEPTEPAFRTPRPDWATTTDCGFLVGGDPVCSHYGELFDSPEVSVSIVRDDVLADGKIIIGETKVVLNSADQLEVDADALAAIGQNMIHAAERVREVL